MKNAARNGSETIFRPYSHSEAQHSDRSAGDRMRHREKVRQSIRENIADIIAEEAIIGKDRDRIVKVPIRGIKEYRFIYGDNATEVVQGKGDEAPGDVIVDKGRQDPAGKNKAGDRPGIDYYETDITIGELIDIMFEDLELPDLERKKLRQTESERLSRRKGYRPVGIRVRLDKRQTVKSKLRRRVAQDKNKQKKQSGIRFPFHNDDLVYRHMTWDIRKESNAVVLCMMDTSGSMDLMKKYLARSFFFLLSRFVNTKYRQVETVFIAHHTEAREVNEKDFFSKGESGGTFISSAYERALETIAERYHPELWNIYAFHCSDGDNFDSDNDAALKGARRLCDVCNLFGYGEIKPHGGSTYESSMMKVFSELEAPNFATVRIEGKEDVWPSFKNLLLKDRALMGKTGS
jgi:sporulation protein YhbH